MPAIANAGCASVLNSTGYTVYSSGGSTTPNQPLASGVTFVDSSVEPNTEVIYTFTMPENANTAASTWTLTFDYDAGDKPAGIGFTAGSAPYPASFGWFGNSLIDKTNGAVMLTLGQDTHSFGTIAATVGLSLPGASVGQVGHVSETPSYKRGSIITKNDRALKIWNARTSPTRGVAAANPVGFGASVSLVSPTPPSPAQSVAKTAAPHRAASRR